MYKAIKWHLFKTFKIWKINTEKFSFIGSIIFILLSILLVTTGYYKSQNMPLDISSWMIYWTILISYFIALMKILPIFRDARNNSISILIGMGISKMSYIMSKLLIAFFYILLYSIFSSILIFNRLGMSASFIIQNIIVNCAEGLSFLSLIFIFGITISNQNAFIVIMGSGFVLILFPLMEGNVSPLHMIDNFSEMGYLYLIQIIVVWMIMCQFSKMINLLRWSNEALKTGKLNYIWSLKSAWDQLRRPREKKRK